MLKLREASISIVAWLAPLVLDELVVLLELLQDHLLAIEEVQEEVQEKQGNTKLERAQIE